MSGIEVSKIIVHVVSVVTGHRQRSIPHLSKELQASDVCLMFVQAKTNKAVRETGLANVVAASRAIFESPGTMDDQGAAAHFIQLDVFLVSLKWC